MMPSARLLRVSEPVTLADEIADLLADAQRLHARMADALTRAAIECAASREPAPTSHLPLYLTVAEAAREAQCSKAVVYHLVSSGELECVRLGTAIRIPRSAMLGLSRRER